VDDAEHMASALRWAASAWGLTSPNPMVGALVVHGERVLGAAAHTAAGRPHAEPLALEQAQSDPDFATSSGAPLTLYVSLEPCVHHGRTPPCVDSILASPIARVVVPHLDPDRRVAGRGVERLRAAGLHVDVGCRAGEAAELNHVFVGRMRRGRAFVALKVALSADDCIAAADGTAADITGAAARAHTHWLRAGHDAVLVGVETLLRDRPRLDRRLYDGPGRTPRRLVVDPQLRADPACLWPGETPRPVVFCSPGAQAARGAGYPADLVAVAERGSGGLDLEALIAALPGLDIWSVLVEGGGRTHRSFLEAGLWDRLWRYRNPRLRLGGLRWQAAATWQGASAELPPHARFDLDHDRLDVFAHPATLLVP